MPKLFATSVELPSKAPATFITIYYSIKMSRNRINVISVAKAFSQAVPSKVCEYSCFEVLCELKINICFVVHHYYNHEEHPGRFQCTICGKNFKAKQGLQV